MAERKVLVKYYPPDFDPKYLKKNTREATQQDNVRMMMPLTCRCNTCGQYAGIGTKYNMRKETCLDENYLGLRIYRFYFKCNSCSAEITFKTDPKNHDYVVEHGATRNYDAQRDMQAAEEVLKQQREDDEEGNAMAFLENRTHDSKREIDINDALEETRHLNKRKLNLTADKIIQQLFLFQADQNDFTEEEQLQIDLVSQNMNVKRLPNEKFLEDDDTLFGEEFKKQTDSFKDYNTTNTNSIQSTKEEEYKKPEKKFKPIIKKKLKVEEQNIENSEQQQKKKNIQILQKKEEPKKETKGLSLLDYGSDSD